MAVFPIPIFRTRQTVVIGITLDKKLPDGLQDKKWTTCERNINGAVVIWCTTVREALQRTRADFSIQ